MLDSMMEFGAGYLICASAGEAAVVLLLLSSALKSPHDADDVGIKDLTLLCRLEDTKNTAITITNVIS